MIYTGNLTYQNTTINAVLTWGEATYSGTLNVNKPVFNASLKVNLQTVVNQALENRLAALENMNVIEVTDNLIAAAQVTTGMPANNPNKIGKIAVVDDSGPNLEVYMIQEFTVINPDQRSVVYYSPITLNNAKIWIWPRE